nr:hypothetical protein [Clostridia bacterium]
SEAIKGMYSDLDGDNDRSEGDKYGFTIPHFMAYDGWLTAFDIPVTTVSSDGRIEAGFVNEKGAAALEKMTTMLYTNPGAYKLEHSFNNVNYFKNGQYTFYISFLRECFDSLRDMEYAYGVLPMPKWDEEQESYHCLISDDYTCWSLPKTVSDLEFVGVITDALCAETFDSVYTVYYDVALKNKYSEDEDTARMMDIIVDSGDFDISFSFGQYLEMMPYMFRELLMEGRSDLMSYYASK